MTITKNVWKAAAFLLILSLITAVMISGTYARYTSTYAGEDTALVAKWEVVASGGGISTSGGAIDLDLFSHAYQNNMTASSGGVYIVAPGVKGDFTLSFNNKSDVAADISFEIATTGSAVALPIEYSFDSGFATTFAAVDLASNLNSTFGAIAADPDDSVPALTRTVYWQWPWSTDSAQNEIDTPFGTASATGANRTTYGLTVTASAVQVQPTE